MNFSLSFALFTTLNILALTLTSCSSETDYGATSKINPNPNKSVSSAEQADANSKSASAGEFFKKGQSLDLYVVMDKSGSLWGGGKVKASDPNCLRLNALLDLIDGLRSQLTQKELVRLNMITFGTMATRVGTVQDTLNTGREELDSMLRSAVCEKPSLFNSNTIYSSALELISDELKAQRTIKKLDVETAIFFSDGAAKDPEESELRASIKTFNESFPKRSFGVLLGKTNDVCNIKKDDGEKLSTVECITEVVGGDEQRIVQSADATQLSETMIQLLKK